MVRAVSVSIDEATATTESREEGKSRASAIPRSLVAIIVLGVVLRLGWWWFAHPGPVSDYLGYRSLALRFFLHGEYTRGGLPTSARTPGYPLFLALGMFVSRSDHWLSLLNVGLSSSAIPLTWWFARRLELHPRIAVLSAAVIAVSPTLVFWATVLGSENLEIVGLLCACALACRADTMRRAVVAGAVFGACVLVRPESICYLLALPVLIWRVVPDRKRIVALSGVALLTCTAVFAPWYVRNEIVVGRGVGLSSNGGFNFYLAHRATGYGWRDLSRTPLAGLDEAAISRRGYSLGIHEIEAHPARLVSTTLRGTRALYDLPGYAAYYSTRLTRGTGPYPASVSQAAVGRAHRLAVDGWLLTATFVVIGVVALAVSPSRRRSLWPLLALLAADWVCFAVVFWGMPRYRLAIEPMLAILAAAGLDAMYRLGRRPVATG